MRLTFIAWGQFNSSKSIKATVEIENNIVTVKPHRSRRHYSVQFETARQIASNSLTRTAGKQLDTIRFNATTGQFIGNGHTLSIHQLSEMIVERVIKESM